MKRCSKVRGAVPMPAGTSAGSEEARGRGCPCEAARDPAPVSSSRAAAFSSAAALQGGGLLLPPLMPLLLGDGHGAGRDFRDLQAGGRSQAHSFAINAHPALTVGPGQRGELACSSGGGGEGLGGSITRAGTALNRALTRGARTSARAAMGVDTPTAGLLRTTGIQGRTTRPGAAGRGARGHRSCRTVGIPVVARRSCTVDHTDTTRGVRSVGGPSTSAATGLSACRVRRRRRRWRVRQVVEAGRTSTSFHLGGHGRRLPRAGRVSAHSSRNPGGHEATALPMPRRQRLKKHPLCRLGAVRGRRIAAEAVRARSVDLRPAPACGIVAAPRVAIAVTARHASPVVVLPPQAGSVQREEDAVRRTDPPCTAVPGRLRRARRGRSRRAAAAAARQWGWPVNGAGGA